MNNSFKSNNSEDIGIDPTTVEVIDVLDLDGSIAPNPNPAKPPKSKGKDLLTKILFSFGVLVLMIGVSFGIYFYLNMGKKKAGETKSFNLENQKVYVGATLSDSVFDYGDFEKVDVTGCSIDKSKVDTSTPGEYEYSMVCDGAKYTAKIEVVQKFEFEVTTKVIYKALGATITPNEFVDSEKVYTYSFANEDNVNDLLYETGGPYKIEINISSDNGKQGKVYSYLFVTDSVSANYLNCSMATSSSSFRYNRTDTFSFDSFRNNLNVPSRIYTFYDLTEEEYLKYVNDIEDGNLTVGDIKGYALRDDKNNRISILTATSNSEINNEAGEEVTQSYNDIEEYYTAKGFKCTK